MALLEQLQSITQLQTSGGIFFFRRRVIDPTAPGGFLPHTDPSCPRARILPGEIVRGEGLKSLKINK